MEGMVGSGVEPPERSREEPMVGGLGGEAEYFCISDSQLRLLFRT